MSCVFYLFIIIMSSDSDSSCEVIHTIGEQNEEPSPVNEVSTILSVVKHLEVT